MVEVSAYEERIYQCSMYLGNWKTHLMSHTIRALLRANNNNRYKIKHCHKEKVWTDKYNNKFAKLD